MLVGPTSELIRPAHDRLGVGMIHSAIFVDMGAAGGMVKVTAGLACGTARLPYPSSQSALGPAAANRRDRSGPSAGTLLTDRRP
jgi:hypothetical protein